MKITLLISMFCLLFISCSNGQQKTNNLPKEPSGPISYKEWKEESKSNIRLLPKYGNVPKTDEQKESDRILIDEVIQRDGSLKKGAENAVKMGWDYFYRRDVKTAMYRFNQAWLLDPTNPNIYWGFAIVYFSFKDYDSALKQLDEGLGLDPDNTNLLTDKGTMYSMRYHTSHNSNDLKMAFEFLNKSYQLDPKNQNTLYKLSILNYEQGDCKNARKFYNECMVLGGRPIESGYANALNEKCK